MPNDARLGLVIGVGLVITVALVFFRKDLISRKPSGDPAAASTNSPVKVPPTPPRSGPRPAKARTVSQSATDGEAPRTEVRVEPQAPRLLSEP